MAAAGEAVPDLLVWPEFIADDDCRELIDCFRRMEASGRLFRNPAGDPYWDHRYLWFTSLPATELRARQLMHVARRRIAQLLRDCYREPAEIYSDSIQLVKWPPGLAMPPHADNCEPDGSANIAPHRDYASVVYLNDDFEGGEIYFPRLGKSIKPRCGLLVGFRGGLEHFHGVHAARGGLRYTMPGWYTRDVDKRDRSELEDV